MPYDSNGNFTVQPGYLAVAGQTIQPSQHNPVLEDLAAAGLSLVLVRDGRAPMTGNLNMNGFKATNLLAGTNALDAINKTQLDAQASAQAIANRGYIYGLTLSTDAVDATNDIDIAAGAAAQDTAASPAVMVLSATLTKRIDAAWAVGTGNGGLDTGAVGNNVYYLWLIQRSDTGVVDALFSLSSTAPTMPTNYDRKRMIGQVIRTAGVNATPWSAGDYAVASSGSIIDNKFSNYTQHVSILAAIPLDDTIPQNNEGVVLMAATIAPKSTTSKLRARAVIIGSTVTANAWCASLFSSASASALDAKYAVSFAADVISIVTLEYVWTPATTSAITVSVNTGPATGATMWTNGNNGGRVFGGAMNCTLVVEEIKA